MEVESVSCNTTVLIRSPVQVVNQLEEPCLVAMAASHHLTAQEAAQAISLEADDKYSLPLDSAHSGHVFVKLKNRRWVVGSELRVFCNWIKHQFWLLLSQMAGDVLVT